MWKRLWEKYWIWIVVTTVFVLFITLFTKNTVIDAVVLDRKINKIKKEQDVFREKSKADSTFLENMKDDEFLEKYARENFFMHAPGEQIYLVEE